MPPPSGEARAPDVQIDADLERERNQVDQQEHDRGNNCGRDPQQSTHAALPRFADPGRMAPGTVAGML